MHPSHHSPPSHLCSFPRESPTVFFTSSFPGFSTCSFKPANPPKGIFFSLLALFLLSFWMSWYLTTLCSEKGDNSNPLEAVLHPAWVCGTGGWLHLSAVPQVPQRLDRLFLSTFLSLWGEDSVGKWKGRMVLKYSSVSQRLWSLYRLRKIQLGEKKRMSEGQERSIQNLVSRHCEPPFVCSWTEWTA